MGMHLEAKVYWNLVHNETTGEGGGEGINSTCIDVGGGGHDSSVSIVTVILAEEKWESGFYSQQRQIFSFLQCPDRLWSSLSVLYSTYRWNVSGVRRPGREADY
jgi:hypothetical protein